MSFLRSKYARIVTVVLILQGIVFYSVALRAENTPTVAPLEGFPTNVNGWQMYKDVKIEQETLDVLKADDTLNRIYVNPDHIVFVREVNNGTQLVTTVINEGAVMPIVTEKAEEVYLLCRLARAQEEGEG